MTPKERVALWVAALSRGERVAELDAFVEGARRPPGHFARLLGRAPAEALAVVPWDDGGSFRAACLFVVHARAGVFDQRMLPSGPSFALGAVSDDGIDLVTGRPETFGRLLSRELPPPDDARDRFADTIGEALLRERHRTARVVRSVDEILAWPGHEPTADLLEAELRRRVRPPRVERDEAGFRDRAAYRFEGWFVEGGFFDRRRLIRVDVRVRADGAEIEREVVLPHVFATVPLVRI